MAKDFLGSVARPFGLLAALRRITVGGLLAAAGLSGSQAAANPARPAADPLAAVQSATIVDRSRKRPALILRLPNSAFSGDPQHRSHRSHSSHRSGSSGGAVAPRVAPKKADPTPAPGTANRLVGEPSPAPATGNSTAAGLLSPTPSQTFSGVIEAIDRQARSITVREPGTPTTRVFAYRDDSKLQTVTGSSIRFDEFEDMSAGQLPVTKNDKVQLTWRTSTDGKTAIVTTVIKTP